MDEHQIASKIDHRLEEGNDDDQRSPDNMNFESSRRHNGSEASPGKIFVGGLARETTSAQFVKHFGKYGEITDSVIMKDRNTGHPRGFGFVTYADAAVVDRVIEDTHIFHGKQVEIKRTIPRGGANSKEFKTKKIFVGGLPTTVDEDEFKGFFSNFGEVVEQQIMRDHSSGRSRGFGFITFESDRSVDDLLANGNRIDFAGTQVEIKKAEPKKPNLLPAPSRRQSNSRDPFGRAQEDTYGEYGGRFSGNSFGPTSYRSSGPYGGGGPYGGRPSPYSGYGGPEFGDYGGYGGGGVGGGGYGGFRADPSLEYSRFGGGFGRGYDVGNEYGGPRDSYAGYGGGGAGGGGGYVGGGYDAGFGGRGGGSYYGNRGGYGGGGSGRYHPYGR